jgi:predicted membrane channel-forming protein YqfA (hemolysin III family)
VGEAKVDVWAWIYWIGLVLFAYGLVTFITSIWSPEAMETAGVFGLYGAPLIGVIGVIMAVVGFVKKEG